MTCNTSKFIGYVKMAAAGMLLGGVLSSCSDLDEQDRFVYIKPADAARKVLIEDFTGQKCVNCPKATDEIHVLQETYGEDNIIAVGIHSASRFCRQQEVCRPPDRSGQYLLLPLGS